MNIIRWFRRRRPAPRVEQPLLAEALVMSAWGLTPADWAGMTEFERRECRRNITAAPRFLA